MKAAGYAPTVEEIDADYHFFLFAEAVSKADPSIDVTDVLRISAKDARNGATLARNFFFFDLADLSQMNS